MSPRVGGREVRLDLILLAGITVLGAALRFTTLDLQSFRYDETVTVLRIIQPNLFDTISAVPGSESSPPLYYAFAWLWSLPFGEGEVGIRSLSALLGVAAIPLASMASVALGLSRRSGLVAALLVAVNPFLIWFSQDARVYSLVFLLSIFGLLLFARVLDRPSPGRFVAWGVVAGLAMMTHYFAGFLLLAEAVLLLVLAANWRWTVAATGIAALLALVVMPVGLQQAANDNASWIGDQPRVERVERAAAQLVGQDTGDAHGAREPWRVPLVVPLLIAVIGVGLLLALGSRRERRAAGLAAVIGAAGVAIPFLVGLVGPDYFNGRNSVAAMAPLTVALTAGFGVERSRWFGPAAGCLLAALALAFSIDVFRQERLQREDFRGIASELGMPGPEGAVVTIRYAANMPLRHYLGLCVAGRGPLRLREVELVGSGEAGRRNALAILPRAFRPAGTRTVSYNYTLTTYRAPRPVEVPLGLLESGDLVGSGANASVLLSPGSPACSPEPSASPSPSPSS